jgi:hypothetical protein
LCQQIVKSYGSEIEIVSRVNEGTGSGFFATIWLLGFIDAAPVMAFLYLKISARERWMLSIVLAVFSWMFFYGLFDWASN